MAQQILNPDELSSLEKRYNGILPAGELMRRAGSAVADVIAERIEPASHVAIVCGPGNNGGDGFAAALALKSRGFAVTCALIGCDRPRTEEARAMFEAWEKAGGITMQDPYNMDPAAAVVDALFGMGLDKPLRGDYQDAAMWFNERQGLRVSIDIPSGLDAMTGNWVGATLGCTADITVAMLAPKAGCFMNVGADAAGLVLVRELDVSVPLSTIGLIEEEDFRHILEPRFKNSHKGTYGHVCVIGGDTGTVGAALLAARSALRMGAGRVTVELMAEHAPVVDPVCPEIMIAADPVDLTKTQCNVVGCGMGFSEKARMRFMEAIESPVPLIIDADALRIMADDLTVQDAVLARRAHTVVTPHPAEAAAILRRTVEKVQEDRISACRELSIQTGAICVLKGAGSVVTLRSSRTWINATGNATLATAGTGDVLAGMLGAMFSQDFDLVSATLSAVWLHGKAVEGREAGVLAGDVAAAAANVLETLRKNNRRRF